MLDYLYVYIERMTLSLSLGYRRRQLSCTFQTEISSWCGNRLCFSIVIMARSTLTGSKGKRNVRKVVRLNRDWLRGESLAIYNEIPRNWHIPWKITLAEKNRESGRR